MLLDIVDIILIATNICVINFMTFPLWMTVDPLSLYGLKIIDCTTVAGSGQKRPLNLKPTTPVGWLFSLELTIKSRSVIVA